MKKSPLNRVDTAMDVFIDTDAVYRIVKKEARLTINKFFDSGLAAELMKENLIAKIERVESNDSSNGLTIKQELINPVIYPFEWSPEMLRAAALCTLRVNEIAQNYGFELKDAGPYNIVFRHSRPLHVDLGSFVLKSKNGAWIAEREFVDCYHSNLRLAEIGLHRIYKHAFLINGNGMSGEQTYVVNKLYQALGWGLSSKIKKLTALYKVTQSGVSLEQVERKIKHRWAAKLVFLFLNSLPFKPVKFNPTKHRRRVNNYNLGTKTVWGDYHLKSGYYDGATIKLSERFEWVLAKIKELNVESVTEIAGNQGVLSRAISNLDGIKSVVCTDYDASAVDELFKQLQSSREHVSVAYFDFMLDEREALTRERGERLRSDMVIVLADTHHPVLTQGYSIHSVFDALESYTRQYMIIEFMPKGLWSAGSAPLTPDWYSQEWFEDSLRERYEIIAEERFGENRLTYLVRIKGQLI